MTNEDKRFITTPDLWPNWPVCPLKRYVQNGREFGIVIAVQTHLSTVFIVNMFALKSGDLMQQLEGRKKYEYPNIDALIADGWVVD
jgi:hypothetical protein